MLLKRSWPAVSQKSAHITNKDILTSTGCALLLCITIISMFMSQISEYLVMHYFPTGVHSPLHEERKRKEKKRKKKKVNKRYYPQTITCEMRDRPKILPAKRYTLSLFLKHTHAHTCMHTRIHFPMGHNTETYPQTPSVH